MQAALTSAATFTVGAAFPLIISMLAPAGTFPWAVSIAGLVGLAAIGARAGEAGVIKPTVRLEFWGAIAMIATALIVSLVGRAV